MQSFKINEFKELKLLEINDSEELFDLVDKNRKYLKQWLPWVDSTITSDDTRKFIQSCIEKFAGNKAFEAGIWFKGKMAGVIGIHEIEWEKEETALGYWIAEEYQGNALVTDSCKVILKYCFDELKLKKVEIRCATENIKSRAIPQRLGFKESGKREMAEWLYDHYVDHVIYSISRDDFNK